MDGACKYKIGSGWCPASPGSPAQHPVWPLPALPLRAELPVAQACPRTVLLLFLLLMAGASAGCRVLLAPLPSAAHRLPWQLLYPHHVYVAFMFSIFFSSGLKSSMRAGYLLEVLCPILFLRLTWAGAHLWNVLLTGQDPAPPKAQLNAFACCSLPGSTFAAASQWPLAPCLSLFQGAPLCKHHPPFSPVLASLKAETISLPRSLPCARNVHSGPAGKRSGGTDRFAATVTDRLIRK